MPSLLDIRRRVRAVKSTQQITKAMKMVAASRLRRAQERIQQARPFATEMLRVLNSLATRVDPAPHPLLDERRAPQAGGKALLFVITADRGLCGSFNTNVDQGAPARSSSRTRRARSRSAWSAGAAATISRRRGFEVRYEQVNLFQALQYAHAQAIAQAAIEAFTAGQVDSVYLVYNEFRSVMSQKIVVERLLPIPRLDVRAAAAGGAAADRLPLRADAGGAVHARCIPRHVEVQVYRALLESNAAFYAAQMTAMDSASRNAGGHDRTADALHEQGSAGGDHARDHRSGFGRRRAIDSFRAKGRRLTVP